MYSLKIKYINSKTYTDMTVLTSIYNTIEGDNVLENIYMMVLNQLNIFDTNTRLNLLASISNLYKYNINDVFTEYKDIYLSYILSVNSYINHLKSKYPDGIFDFDVEIRDNDNNIIE